ncbi:MAG: hypothetical protein QM775_14715 [Pirellulales bacterium]
MWFCPISATTNVGRPSPTVRPVGKYIVKSFIGGILSAYSRRSSACSAERINAQRRAAPEVAAEVYS